MSKQISFEIKNPFSRNKNKTIKIITNREKFHKHLELCEVLMNRPIEDIHMDVDIPENENDDNDKPKSKVKKKARKKNNSHKKIKSHDSDESCEEKEKLIVWISNNIDVETKIHKEIFLLLKQIFDKRYKLYPNNVCSLSEFSTHFKNKVEMYCYKDYDLSVYILYILYHKFVNLFEYIDKEVDIGTLKIEDFRNLKEIIYHLGNDLQNIFIDAINTVCKTFDFKFSNILMILFDEYLVGVNKLKESLMIQVALMEEKVEYLNSIDGIMKVNYTKNIENWVNDVIDINIETENNNSEEKINNDKNILNNNSINNGLISKPKEYNIKDIHKLNIEDLVSYINEPKPKTNNKKKTKKKKKAKKENEENKEIENNNKDNKNENTSIEEDLIFDDFKKCIEESYSKNHFLYPKKIEPKISDSFLKQLEIYYE